MDSNITKKIDYIKYVFNMFGYMLKAMYYLATAKVCITESYCVPISILRHKETLKIIDTFRTNNIKSRLTYLDLSNRFEIKLTIDGSFDVNLGDMGDIDTKLATVTETIAKAQQSGFVGGEINMITPTSCSFKGEFPAADEKEDSKESAEEQDAVEE